MPHPTVIPFQHRLLTRCQLSRENYFSISYSRRRVNGELWGTILVTETPPVSHINRWFSYSHSNNMSHHAHGCICPINACLILVVCQNVNSADPTIKWTASSLPIDMPPPAATTTKVIPRLLFCLWNFSKIFPVWSVSVTLRIWFGHF